MIPAGVRAVFFDAVGTLLHPDPSPAYVYATVGRQFGCRYSEEEVGTRFRAAFRAEDEADRCAGWRTGEERELARWHRIVATVLDGLTGRAAEECFRELWAHFARPEAWRCDPDAATVLVELARRGYVLGMASNFDGRLHRVAAGLPALAALACIVISSEVGWRKPAPEFFAALCASVELPPAQVLVVGDDPTNDGAARAAGLHVRLLAGAGPDGLDRLRDLLEE
jgi:putative hydrolase of the HAD superfamily